ncbi:MAG: STAS domain-containing protein [Ilumatobacteraceae bacterium]
MTEFTNETLSIVVAEDGTIVVTGDIDMAGGPLLDAALSQRDDDRAVVIDLAGVPFIDSSGLRSLLDGARRAHARNTEVVLRAVGPEVSRLLELTGAGSQFRIEPRRD